MIQDGDKTADYGRKNLTISMILSLYSDSIGISRITSGSFKPFLNISTTQHYHTCTLTSSHKSIKAAQTIQQPTHPPVSITMDFMLNQNFREDGQQGEWYINKHFIDHK